MNRDQLLTELRTIDSVLGASTKRTAYHRARNYRTIDPSAAPNSEGPTEINAELFAVDEMRQEANVLVAKRNEIMAQLAQPGK
jgi:hypothetical protein